MVIKVFFPCYIRLLYIIIIITFSFIKKLQFLLSPLRRDNGKNISIDLSIYSLYKSISALLHSLHLHNDKKSFSLFLIATASPKPRLWQKKLSRYSYHVHYDVTMTKISIFISALRIQWIDNDKNTFFQCYVHYRVIKKKIVFRCW